jgi:hypothetical protein
MDRHLGAVQAVFVDQSARRVPVRRLWKLKWHNSFNPDAVYS